MPEARWLDLDAARADVPAVQAAVVAKPPAGSLQGLPVLRLIQSLWAGADRLLADTTLPAGHRYWQHPHVTVLPHATAATDSRSAAFVAAANLRAVRDGGVLAHLVSAARGY